MMSRRGYSPPRERSLALTRTLLDRVPKWAHVHGQQCFPRKCTPFATEESEPICYASPINAMFAYIYTARNPRSLPSLALIMTLRILGSRLRHPFILTYITQHP